MPQLSRTGSDAAPWYIPASLKKPRNDQSICQKDLPELPTFLDRAQENDALSIASKHIFANAARNVRSLVIDPRVCSSAGEFDVKCDLIAELSLAGRSCA